MDTNHLIEKEARIRGLSNRTIETYCFCVNKFLLWSKKDPHYVRKTDVKDFLEFLIKKGLSGSTLNVYMNALKFLLREILHKSVFFNIKYTKTPQRLPVFLSQEEVKRIINSINNPIHKLIIELMYSAGLRVSEVVNLRKDDLEINNKIGWVRNGKGGKDRLFIIAEALIQTLNEYVTNSNGEYLFMGRNNKHLSQRSVQEIVKSAAKKVGIKKKVHCHTLRHSFATHLIENGYDVATVQSLLGHSSAKTTMVYIHMASPKLINVKSPYDSLQ